MTEKGFCESCIRENERCYGKIAEEIAFDAKKSHIDKHKELAQNRDKAREDLCARVNKDELNPDYRGKSKL